MDAINKYCHAEPSAAQAVHEKEYMYHKLTSYILLTSEALLVRACWLLMIIPCVFPPASRAAFQQWSSCCSAGCSHPRAPRLHLHPGAPAPCRGSSPRAPSSEDGCASGPANGTAEISIGDAPLSRPVVSCLVPGLHTHYLFCQVMPANATSASRNETVQAVYEEEYRYHTSEDYLDGPLVHAGCSEAPHTGSRCCFL